MTPVLATENQVHHLVNTYSSECYEWMASFIDANSMVLEVGCGSGESTLKIVQKGCRVVALEIDPALSEEAVTYLNRNGVPSKLITASELSLSLSEPEFKVLIICGDVFDDDIGSKITDCKFNVICSWLMSGSKEQVAKHLKRSVNSVMRADIRNYTDSIHRKIYTLSRGSLSSGGYVHFVDSKALENLNDDAYGRKSVAAQHQYLSRDMLKISKENVTLKKVADFPSAHESLRKTRALDDSTIIPVLSSVIAFAR